VYAAGLLKLSPSKDWTHGMLHTAGTRRFGGFSPQVYFTPACTRVYKPICVCKLCHQLSSNPISAEVSACHGRWVLINTTFISSTLIQHLVPWHSKLCINTVQHNNNTLPSHSVCTPAQRMFQFQVVFPFSCQFSLRPQPPQGMALMLYGACVLLQAQPPPGWLPAFHAALEAMPQVSAHCM